MLKKIEYNTFDEVLKELVLFFSSVLFILLLSTYTLASEYDVKEIVTDGRAVIIDGDIKKGCDIVHNTVKDLYKDKIPLNMFTMTKKLSRPPEEYTAKAPHVELALKLAKKDPVMAPVAGDRVEFVIYAGSAMISKRACVPKDITDGKYMVDRDYYMNKQLKTPLLRILERIVKNPKDLFKVNAIKKRPPTGSNPFAKWRKKLKFS